MNLDHVLRAEIHVTRNGPDAYGELQDAFLQGFSSLPRPARCVSAAAGLAHGGMVEIGVIAADRKPDPTGAIIAPDGPAPCAPFPHARAHAGGLWLTAQVGSDPASGSLAPVAGGSAAQLRYAVSNLKAILRAGGSDTARIVHGRLQYADPLEREMLLSMLAANNMPVEAFLPMEVPFIPTAQAGVTVKLDAAARCAI
jgi:enamine deaminase RidA (YjgF/YER057c/UK114 family)